MTSNLMSRFLPSNSTTSPSVYEAIQQHDDEADTSDVEERAGMAIDEENLGNQFHDHDLEDALADTSDAHKGDRDSQLFGRFSRTMGKEPLHKSRRIRSNRPRWMQSSPGSAEPDDGENDVPPSLLVEGAPDGDGFDPPPPPPPPKNHSSPGIDEPIPGPSTQETRYQWNTTRAHQPLHSIPPRILPPSLSPRPRRGLAMVDPKEKAMWRWANVENLDNFVKDVYVYFLENGIWCIVLGRALNLL